MERRREGRREKEGNEGGGREEEREEEGEEEGGGEGPGGLPEAGRAEGGKEQLPREEPSFLTSQVVLEFSSKVSSAKDESETSWMSASSLGLCFFSVNEGRAPGGS